MIATMYSVRCRDCGGDSAPIVNGEHVSSDYCREWTNRVEKTLESIRRALQHKIEESMPGDSVPDSVAIPRLNRLEERQHKIDSAIDLLLAEVRRQKTPKASNSTNRPISQPLNHLFNYLTD